MQNWLNLNLSAQIANFVPTEKLAELKWPFVTSYVDQSVPEGLHNKFKAS